MKDVVVVVAVVRENGLWLLVVWVSD